MGIGNGYRQFNTAYVEIPKKMGKSELAAAIALLLTCGDNEERAEVYGCDCTTTEDKKHKNTSQHNYFPYIQNAF
jgi:phage terminase large subunit-like protein